jgi:hypothetical protein
MKNSNVKCGWDPVLGICQKTVLGAPAEVLLGKSEFGDGEQICEWEKLISFSQDRFLKLRANLRAMSRKVARRDFGPPPPASPRPHVHAARAAARYYSITATRRQDAVAGALAGAGAFSARAGVGQRA